MKTVTALFVALAPSLAFAGGEHPVGGTLATEVVACDSLCTQSTWTGALAGTSRFTLIEQAELAIPGAKLSTFHGRLVLSTPRGDLIGEDHGLWNLATGAYIDVYTVSSGTGDYADARGSIVLTGTLDPASGHGDSRYAGVIARVAKR